MRTVFATFALLILATVFAQCKDKSVNKLSKKYGKCIAKGYDSTIDGCAEAFEGKRNKKKKGKLNRKKKKRCAKIEKKLKKCGYSCVDSTESPTNSPTLRPTSTPTNSPTVRPTSTPTNSPKVRPTSAPTCSSTCASGQFASCSRNQDTVCRSCRKCGADLIIATRCSGTRNTVCASSHFFGLGKDQAVWRHLADGRPSWKRITTGKVKQVEVFQNQIFGLGLDNLIYKWTGRWTKNSPPTPLRRFEIVGNAIYALGLDHGIWRSTGGGRFVNLTTSWVSDFAIHDGHFYGVGKDQAVWKHPMGGKGRWVRTTTGKMTQVNVSQNGVIFGLGLDKVIWRWINGAWERYIDKAIYRWMNGGFKLYSMVGVKKFVLTSRGIFGLSTTGEIVRKSTSGPRWIRVTGGTVTDFVHTFKVVN